MTCGSPFRCDTCRRPSNDLNNTYNNINTGMTLIILFLPAATKLGQGNIFTGVRLSTGGRGSASVHAGIYPPGPDPLAAHRPWEQTPPWSRHPPGADPPRRRHHPPGPDPPVSTPLGADTPPDQTPTPGKQTPAYGQRAVGTHPTGMHSCSLFSDMNNKYRTTDPTC